LDRIAPTHIKVASGSRIKLRYRPGEVPVLPVRIQQMFGCAETPTVAGGKPLTGKSKRNWPVATPGITGRKTRLRPRPPTGPSAGSPEVPGVGLAHYCRHIKWVSPGFSQADTSVSHLLCPQTITIHY
jgi:hypothetical protein